MATFGGTTQKCKACEKTVYLVDQLKADSKVYHKACFRCHHCKGTLKLSNYNSYEGVLYCRPHFDQLFKMTGSLNKSFEGGPRTVKERSLDKTQSNNKVSALFGGTQDKCVACKKTVYPLEKVAVDGTSYHRTCFKCSHGGCVISPSNYVAHDHKLYCRHHHTQLFKQRGNFSHMEDHEKIKGVTENGKDHEKIKEVTENGKDHEKIKGVTENGKDHEKIKGVTENGKDHEKIKGVTENGKDHEKIKGVTENGKDHEKIKEVTENGIA